MVLKNKLGIENSAELARLEEQISKKKGRALAMRKAMSTVASTNGESA